MVLRIASSFFHPSLDHWSVCLARFSMSRTSIELNQIAAPQVPQAVFAKTPSTRRPSTIASNAQSDEVTLRGLERSPTTTTSKATTAIVIASVTLITGISTLLSGLTTVTLPTMAVDLEIPDNLLLWYLQPLMYQGVLNVLTWGAGRLPSRL